MLTTHNIISKIDDGVFDYEALAKDSIIIVQDNFMAYDINFIITARGRLDFAQVMFDSFAKARDNTDLKVCYTLVEHSASPQHSKICKNNNTNYIWIQSRSDEQFNKCLAYNMGALFTNNCKWFLFHDIDILIRSNCFELLSENIKNISLESETGEACYALQCYANRRVLNCSLKISKELIAGEVAVDDIDENTDGVGPPMWGGKPSLGSKGGSIMVEKDMFFAIGGFDPELFRAYSHEDAFFWEKLSNVTNIGYADKPPVEMFHMWHEPQYSHNPHLYEMKEIFDSFCALSKEERLKIINHKSHKLDKFATSVQLK